MTQRRPGMLEPLRARVRRVQLIVGAAFLALVFGAIFYQVLAVRLLERLPVGTPVSSTLDRVLGQLWAWAMLPLILYGFARVIDLRPWSSAVGAAVSGLGFQFVMMFAWAGLDGFAQNMTQVVLVLVTTAVGTVLSARAIVAARAAAAQVQEEARKKADARKDEYAEFIREAERVAALKDEGAPSTPPAEPPKSEQAS